MKRFHIHRFPIGFDCGLSLISFILSINTHKTVEVAVWLNEKGIVLMGVGGSTLVFGFILARVRH
jgi:hypothetical protein